MDTFQLIATALIGAILAVTIKSYKPELAIGISIVTGVLLLIISVVKIDDVFKEFDNIVNKSGINREYFNVMVKVVGIAYITQFAAEICRDSGQNGIAVKLEGAGKICIMTLSIPIISNFFELIVNILN